MSILNYFRKRIEKVKEEVEIEGEAKRLFEKLLKVFGSRDDTKRLVNKNDSWRKYIYQRRCWVTYDIGCHRSGYESHQATEKNTKSFIKQLLSLRKGLSEFETLGLAMIMDEIDYSYCCGMFFHPSPIDYIEEKKFADRLPKIVNSLVRDYGIDPFELEERLKELYKTLNLRSFLPGFRYVAGVVFRAEVRERA